MKRRTCILTATILTAGTLILACHGALADTLYVAIQGNDAHPGTKEQPFATVERGVEATRALPGPHKILIRPGTYYLTRPLDLDPEDSGLSIEGEGEGVVISGGRRVVGWKPWQGKILKADLAKNLR